MAPSVCRRGRCERGRRQTGFAQHPVAVTLDFERQAGPPIQAFLVPSGAVCDRSAILAIELTSGRDVYAVTRTALDQAEVRLPIAPPRTVKLDAASDAELVVAALGPRGRDPLFARCLAYAARLWALEPHAGGSRR